MELQLVVDIAVLLCLNLPPSQGHRFDDAHLLKGYRTNLRISSSKSHDFSFTCYAPGHITRVIYERRVFH